jgi:hypothetical protein
MVNGHDYPPLRAFLLVAGPGLAGGNRNGEAIGD